MKKAFSITLISILVISLCNMGISMSEVRDISAKELEVMINEGQPVVVIDVREPIEYIAEHILGSILFPVDSIISNSKILEKDSQYMIICGKGGRSRLVSDFLVKEGFSNVTNVTGGLAEYEGKTVKLTEQKVMVTSYNPDISVEWIMQDFDDIDGNVVNISCMVKEKPVVVFYYKNHS